MDSASLLHHFHKEHSKTHGKDINLTLRPAYKDLLAALGHPERQLPPTIHIAGTNGKGSTGAFLRAIIEATGKTVHVTTSPHLISFHERIRIAGELISEEELTSILTEIKEKAPTGSISFFEAAIAAALVAFTRHHADVAIIEVGLGGRLDATNIIPKSIASIITRLSFDHRDFLGDSIGQIAREKAGIMRQSTPCYTAAQPAPEAMEALHAEADDKCTPLHMAGIEWNTITHEDGSFDFISAKRTLRHLPAPALVGAHQIQNAGLAIATLDALPFNVPDAAIHKAMTSVWWPGRLQQLKKGKLYDLLPNHCELWLDGGHNDSAGEALAAYIKTWDQPIDLVLGLLTSKRVEEYLTPLLPYIRSIKTLKIEGEIPGHEAEELAKQIKSLGHKDVQATSSLTNALKSIANTTEPATHTLISGSLYLAGQALQENDDY